MLISLLEENRSLRQQWDRRCFFRQKENFQDKRRHASVRTRRRKYRHGLDGAEAEEYLVINVKSARFCISSSHLLEFKFNYILLEAKVKYYFTGWIYYFANIVYYYCSWGELAEIRGDLLLQIFR
jgi:hypothetical protein